MRTIKKRLTTLVLASALLATSPATMMAQTREVKLKIVQTTDIHGNYYPYDFIRRQEAEGSLARVHAFVEKKRELYGDNLILLDNGDFLQGQPTAYYYNYIDTVSPHLGAEMMNFIRYDAGNLGNHDIETGRRVWERWMGDCQFPVLCANAIDTQTGEPAYLPYVIFEREGVKIAVLGMITPGIPAWLSEDLWRGLRFDDMEETARKWMPVLKEKERADLIIGLFHTGLQAYDLAGRYRENAAQEVAEHVPGFDIVLAGHDHAQAKKWVTNVAGDSVYVTNPANNGVLITNIDVTVTLEGDSVTGKRIKGVLSKTAGYGISQPFVDHFAAGRQVIEDFVSKKIGTFCQTISTRPAYFGPSAFVDLIHQLQLEISGAEISLAAPLSFDTQIEAGDVYVSDMFNLYKYENMLYTMALTGQEVHDLLEMSYAQWTRQMTSAQDTLLLLRPVPRAGAKDRAMFQHASYNFDSAAGIRYTVDVSQPAGQRVHIESMADGTPFDPERTYRVAVNSYRGNGGGELLTRGAGIDPDRLSERILSSTDKDLRYYLMQLIERLGEVDPQPLNQWRFVPEAWVQEAAQRDYRTLFGE